MKTEYFYDESSNISLTKVNKQTNFIWINFIFYVYFIYSQFIIIFSNFFHWHSKKSYDFQKSFFCDNLLIIKEVYKLMIHNNIYALEN